MKMPQIEKVANLGPVWENMIRDNSEELITV